MNNDLKNKPNTQVKRANASSIKRRIDESCRKYPLTFDYQETNLPITEIRITDSDFYGNPISRNVWTYNQRRTKFIYEVINYNEFYIHEGVSLGVTSNEIFEKYTQLNHSLKEIEKFEFLEEFNLFLYKCLLKVFEEEEFENQSLKEGSLLEQLMLHNSTPHLILKSISEDEKKIKEVDLGLRKLFDDLRLKKINTSDFESLRKQLDGRMDQLRMHQEYLTSSYKRIVETSKYRRRKYLRMYFSDVKTVLNLDTEFLPKINCKSVSVCMFIIDEYCRWYNRTFSVQILETRKNYDKLRRKMKRNASLKPDMRLEQLKPYMGTTLSVRQIASITGISKSTVQRLMKELSQDTNIDPK